VIVGSPLEFFHSGINSIFVNPALDDERVRRNAIGDSQKWIDIEEHDPAAKQHDDRNQDATTQ
jgi:hypothetical protein